ncbi:MAG: pyruvate ferredoxin oxidoreductase, partial [Methanoregula sp.]
ALYGSGIPVYDYILGLGGRDVQKKDIREVVALAEKGKGDQFIGLRREVL